MVDTMTMLGVAAAAKLTADRLVRDIVSYIRGNKAPPSSLTHKRLPSHSRSRRRPRKERLSRNFKANTSGLGRRPSSSNRHGRKVHAMTDDELEAELEHRRHRRAKEREMYSRAMRSEKLKTLESELESLRKEIGQIDHSRPSVRFERSGTPAHARWEALPRNRNAIVDNGGEKQPGSLVNMPPNGIKSPSGPPPPPPPPPPPHGGDDDEDLVIDPEKQKREKLERQKRREAKKKEREQTQKKLTLADIIRSAGADPTKRLKPASKKPADLDKEEWERAKREREQREKQEEEDRIEQERIAKEGISSKVSEESVKKGEDVKSDEPENPMPENTKNDDKTPKSQSGIEKIKDQGMEESTFAEPCPEESKEANCGDKQEKNDVPVAEDDKANCSNSQEVSVVTELVKNS